MQLNASFFYLNVLDLNISLGDSLVKLLLDIIDRNNDEHLADALVDRVAGSLQLLEGELGTKLLPLDVHLLLLDGIQKLGSLHESSFNLSYLFYYKNT